jgi:hypothetical protein
MAAGVVINIPPTAVLDGDSPHEWWFQNIPATSHLRVFGCVAYRHVSKYLRKKTEGRQSSVCLLVTTPGGYDLLLHDLEVVRAKDVMFIENKPVRIPPRLLRKYTGEQVWCGCNQCAVAEEQPALTQGEIPAWSRSKRTQLKGRLRINTQRVGSKNIRRKFKERQSLRDNTGRLQPKRQYLGILNGDIDPQVEAPSIGRWPIGPWCI